MLHSMALIGKCINSAQTNCISSANQIKATNALPVPEASVNSTNVALGMVLSKTKPKLSVCVCVDNSVRQGASAFTFTTNCKQHTASQAVSVSLFTLAVVGGKTKSSVGYAPLPSLHTHPARSSAPLAGMFGSSHRTPR